MLVKQIGLYIKAKRKIHDNLSHKEHRTHFPHPHSLFVNLPQMLRPTTPHHTHQTTALLHQATRSLTHVKRRERNLYVSNISAVQQIVLIY